MTCKWVFFFFFALNIFDISIVTVRRLSFISQREIKQEAQVMMRLMCMLPDSHAKYKWFIFMIKTGQRFSAKLKLFTCFELFPIMVIFFKFIFIRKWKLKSESPFCFWYSFYGAYDIIYVAFSMQYWNRECQIATSWLKHVDPGSGYLFLPTVPTKSAREELGLVFITA